MLLPANYLLLSSSTFPRTHSTFFPSFLQKIFTAIFLLLLPAAQLFASFAGAESDHRRNRTSSCLFVGRRGQLATFQILPFECVTSFPETFLTCRNSTALFQLALIAFPFSSELVFLFLKLLHTLFHLFLPSVRAAPGKLSHFHSTTSKSKEATSFFSASHCRVPVPTQESKEIWGNFLHHRKTFFSTVFRTEIARIRRC